MSVSKRRKLPPSHYGNSCAPLSLWILLGSLPSSLRLREREREGGREGSEPSSDQLISLSISLWFAQEVPSAATLW